MKVDIVEGVWGGSGTCYRILIDGQCLCKVFKRENAEKIRGWLLEHGIDGKSKFKARPLMERFQFEQMSFFIGDKGPFDYAPWCAR
jgi:hypothetical protein